MTRRTQNPRQKLASERNWALLSLRSAESQLHTVKKLFPALLISDAVFEIRRLKTSLDAEWKDRRVDILENELDPR